VLEVVGHHCTSGACSQNYDAFRDIVLLVS